MNPRGAFGLQKTMIPIFIAWMMLGGLDIPGLVEVPSSGTGRNAMAVFYTGDGGWRATDRRIAQVLKENGIPVVGINTMRYFWSRHTPEQAALDLARVLEHYQSMWKKDKIIVIGYSYGADVLPFLLNRIPAALVKRIELFALLAPTQRVDFQFHFKQWFSADQPETAKPVLPELESLRNLKIMLFCGDQDRESLCRKLPQGKYETVTLHASHRFDKYYQQIARDILKKIR
jgi:type IV secretory pathway VirJ component